VTTHRHEPRDPDERVEDQLLDELRDRGYRIAVRCIRCGHWLTADRSVAEHTGPRCRRRDAA